MSMKLKLFHIPDEVSTAMIYGDAFYFNGSISSLRNFYKRFSSLYVNIKEVISKYNSHAIINIGKSRMSKLGQLGN
jgi:hypothetical protein